MAKYVEQFLSVSKITIVTIPGCFGCEQIKTFFKDIGVWSHCQLLKLNEVDDDEYDEVVTTLKGLAGTKQCPMVFFGDTFVGDHAKIELMHVIGTLREVLLKRLNITIQKDTIDF